MLDFLSRNGTVEPPRIFYGNDDVSLFTFSLLLFFGLRCPTAAEISISLEAGRTHLGQAEGTEAEAALDEYIQEAGLEAWTFLVTWALNFVYSGRHGEHANRVTPSSTRETRASWCTHT